MTQEQKQDILRKYNNRNIKVADIATEYRLSRGDVAKIAVEMGAEPRQAQKYGKKIVQSKRQKRPTVCHKCHKRVDVKGAKYCCYCGADIRTPQDILTEKLNALIANVRFMPENMRDETRDILLAAIEEINSK